MKQLSVMGVLVGVLMSLSPAMAAPLEIVRATFLGNGEGDIQGVAAGPDGTLYVAGNTEAPAAELPGGIEPATLGSDVADARCGCGFVARLSPDGGKILAYAQFAKGIATLTTVQVNEQGVYAGGYASDGLAPLLSDRKGLIRTYPLTNEVRLIREGKIMEACGETAVTNQPPKDPLADRPGLGRYGAPCVIRFSKDLKALQAGTYLEGWQQVWDKHRVTRRAVNPQTKQKESIMVPREYLWQPTGIGLLRTGDVIVGHDGGYFRLLTDDDRKLAGTNTFLLSRLGFENVCDWVSRLSPDLSERKWKKPVYTPAVNPDVARQLKQGWPYPWYSNPRTLRLRLDKQDDIVLCGWSASATVNEPYWTPYLWKMDPKTGELIWKAYEIDPMSGPDHRMNGNVADTAVATVAVDDDNNLLTALHSDGGNNFMGAGPRSPEGIKTWASPVKRGGYSGGLVHFNGQMHRINGKTRDGLAGAGSGHCAWTIDMAALAGNGVLAVGRCNGDIQLTPDAWSTNSPQTNPNAYVRVYDPLFEMTFSTVMPGVWPFELQRTSADTYAVVGFATPETTLVRDSLAPKSEVKRNGYLLLMKQITTASAALWQYNVPSGAGNAFLWIPPSCETVRGLLVMGQLSIEGELIYDPAVRKACTEAGIGLVYFQPHISGTFLYWQPGNTDTQRWLTAFDDLAKRSGHPEIRRVPWITAGHSTAGIYCRNVAYWQPTRVAGVFHIKSGNFHQANIAPTNASFAGVPLVAFNGQLETFGPAIGIDPVYGRETQWVYARKDLLQFRAANPQYLVSILVHPGDDHFHGAPELGGQLALFLRKVAQYRLPKTLPPGTEPVTCLAVKAEDGWLTDADIEAPTYPAAAYADYNGPKTNAFWHFDREIAEATLLFNRNLAKHQCLSSPECMWLDDGDGWTFKASAQWLDTWPEKFGGRMKDQKIGHADSPFIYRCKVNEPVRQIGPDTFQLLRLPVGKRTAVNIAAFHPGDAQYRATVRWGGPALPSVKGQPQTLDFPAIADLKPGQTVTLAAKASSGLPVHYEVDYGPVTVTDGKLTISELPSNPQFPIECKVTAYQIGRRTEPAIQSAAPISQVFQVIQQ